MIRRDLNNRFDFDIDETESGQWGVALLPKWSTQGTNTLETFPSLGEAEDYCRNHQGLEQVPWTCLQCESERVFPKQADDAMDQHGPIMVYGYVECFNCFHAWKDHKVRNELLVEKANG